MSAFPDTTASCPSSSRNLANKSASLVSSSTTRILTAPERKRSTGQHAMGVSTHSRTTIRCPLMALALSDLCPSFELVGTDDKTHSLASFDDAKVLVVIVSCNHCPYVVAYEPRMVSIANAYLAN